MMQISGHWVNPAHVSAVHVVQRKSWAQKRQGWRQWEIEVQMSSGYTFLDWPNGSDSLYEAEQSRNDLAQLINRHLEVK
jgi:hypothetical protein